MSMDRSDAKVIFTKMARPRREVGEDPRTQCGGGDVDDASVEQRRTEDRVDSGCAKGHERKATSGGGRR